MCNLRITRAFLVCVLTLSSFAGSAFAGSAFTEEEGVSREDVVKRLENSQTYFTETMSNPETAVPRDLLAKANGFVILRTLKIGYVVGTSGGGGIAMMKDEQSGEWSPPAFVATAEMSFGLQLGAETANAIYVVMTREAMEKLLKGDLKIGAGISTQVGPVGKDADVELGEVPDVFIYSRNPGLFAGVAFKAASFGEDRSANEAFYGKEVSAKHILFNKAVEMPAEANEFVKFLKAHSGDVR